MRPTKIDQFVGQDHLLGAGKLLSGMVAAGKLQSLILWGPPGSGKTTLAQILASSAGAACVHFSAVTSGIKDLKKIIQEAEQLRRAGKPTVLFVDEIHHFNKAQQDNFLPHVERGTLILIGATTENPSFEVISPLCQEVPKGSATEVSPVRLCRSRVPLLDGVANQRGVAVDDVSEFAVRHSKEQTSDDAEMNNKKDAHR